MNPEVEESFGIADLAALKSSFLSAQDNAETWQVPMNFEVVCSSEKQTVVYYSPALGECLELDLGNVKLREALATEGIYDCAAVSAQGEFFTVLIHAYGAKALGKLLNFCEKLLKTENLKPLAEVINLYTNRQYFLKIPSYLLAISSFTKLFSRQKFKHQFVGPRDEIAISAV